MATCPFNGFKPCENACALKLNGMCALVVQGGRMTQIKQAIEGLQGSIDELALSLMDNDEPEAQKAVREVNDQELDKYVEAVNPLTIANVTTSQVYRDFERWCAGRGLSPCSQHKLSRRITHFHPLEAKAGTFVAISKARA